MEFRGSRRDGLFIAGIGGALTVMFAFTGGSLLGLLAPLAATGLGGGIAFLSYKKSRLVIDDKGIWRHDAFSHRHIAWDGFWSYRFELLGRHQTPSLTLVGEGTRIDVAVSDFIDGGKAHDMLVDKAHELLGRHHKHDFTPFSLEGHALLHEKKGTLLLSELEDVVLGGDLVFHTRDQAFAWERLSIEKVTNPFLLMVELAKLGVIVREEALFIPSSVRLQLARARAAHANT